MNISRRSFLGGAIACAAVARLSLPYAPMLPKIYGDGLYDDLPGLQALFDGKPFRIAGEGFAAFQAAHQVTLQAGLFLLSDTLVIGRGLPALIVGGVFRGRRHRPLFRVEGTAGSVIQSAFFDRA